MVFKFLLLEDTVLESSATIFTIPILGGIAITESIVMTWVIMAVLVGCSIFLTRNMQTVPKGKQVFTEWVVETINNFQKSLLDHHWKSYAPYIGTVALFLALANTVGVLGLGYLGIKPPTKDLSVTAALAIMTIVIVVASSIKVRGFGGFIKHLFKPVPFMVIFNLLDLITRPLSLTMRLFGNILAGAIVMEMLENVVFLHLGVAVIFSFYFDIFDGLLQMVVFVFLTTLYIREAIE